MQLDSFVSEFISYLTYDSYLEQIYKSTFLSNGSTSHSYNRKLSNFIKKKGKTMEIILNTIFGLSIINSDVFLNSTILHSI